MDSSAQQCEKRIRIATEQLELWIPGSTNCASHTPGTPSRHTGDASARTPSTFDQQAMPGLKVHALRCFMVHSLPCCAQCLIRNHGCKHRSKQSAAFRMLRVGTCTAHPDTTLNSLLHTSSAAGANAAWPMCLPLLCWPCCSKPNGHIAWRMHR